MTDPKRSAAAKKAAETRKAKAAEQEGSDQPEQPEQEGGDQPEPEGQEDQEREEVEEYHRGRKVGDHVIHGGRSFRADVPVPPEWQTELESVRQAQLDHNREDHNRRTGDLSVLIDP